MFLTQAGGFLGPIAKLLGLIMNGIFVVLDKVGIPNVGLAIILFTVVIRLILFPFSIGQQKGARINTFMQPEISKIQKKYRNKKDQASMMKQNEEIQEVYAKYGYSMSGSCVQLIIQMPILFALYRVIYNIPAYIGQIKELYINIVTPIQQTPGFLDKLLDIQKAEKIVSRGAQLKEGVKPTANAIVDFLYQFKPETWDKLKDSFAGSPDVVRAIAENGTNINKYNEFIFGINIAETPWNAGLFSPYLLIPLTAALFQFLSARMMMPKTDTMGENNMAAGMTKGMMYYMPIMSLVFCFTLPAGVGIYWSIGALLQIVQQWGINKYLDHVDMDAFIEKNKAKAAKKAASGKKSFMQKMMEGQNPQQGGSSSSSDQKISDIASISTKKVAAKGGYVNNLNAHISELESPSQAGDNNKKVEGSIAAKANLMLNSGNKSNNKGGNK